MIVIREEKLVLVVNEVPHRLRKKEETENVVIEGHWAILV